MFSYIDIARANTSNYIMKYYEFSIIKFYLPFLVLYSDITLKKNKKKLNPKYLT